MTHVHEPVLVEEILRGFALQPGAVVVDATVGFGGHAEALLQAIGPDGRLVGVDRDRDALEQAAKRLENYGDRVKLVHGTFGELARLLTELQVERADAVLFDLGVSSYQLDTPKRGFSFLREGPLDMRMDQTQQRTAAEIINRARVENLADFLREFGQERWAGRIARAIVRGRPFRTTTELAEAIRRAVPPAGRHQGRIDPATRTFQALRIAVNRELELLPEGLKQGVDCLKPGGRIAVLAYHSLEDRIAKVVFREQARQGRLKVLTPKPVRPSEEEVARNSRSRSAHLRMAHRTEP